MAPVHINPEHMEASVSLIINTLWTEQRPLTPEEVILLVPIRTTAIQTFGQMKNKLFWNLEQGMAS